MQKLVTSSQSRQLATKKELPGMNQLRSIRVILTTSFGLHTACQCRDGYLHHVGLCCPDRAEGGAEFNLNHHDTVKW